MAAFAPVTMLLSLLLAPADGAEWRVEVPLNGADAASVRAAPAPFGPECEGLVYAALEGGARADVRMARLLDRYGFRGTFFLSPSSDVVPRELGLVQLGMDIGSWGVSAQRLSLLSPEAIDYELRASRAKLQARTGLPAPSFTYPLGDRGVRAYIQREIAERLLHAGYDGLRAPSSDPLGLHNPAWPELRDVEVPSVNFGEESLFVRTESKVTERGLGVGAGIWGTTWELSAPTEGVSAYKWGEAAGRLRQWAGQPGIAYVSFNEAVAASRRLTGVTVAESGVDDGVAFAIIRLEPGAADLMQGHALSVLFTGVQSDAATLNGEPVPAHPTKAGTRVGLYAPGDETPPAEPRYAPAPEGWALVLSQGGSGLPTQALLETTRVDGVTTESVALDAPFGWTAEPSAADLAPSERSVVFELAPPSDWAAGRSIFVARVSGHDSQGPVIYVLSAETPSSDPAPGSLSGALAVLAAGDDSPWFPVEAAPDPPEDAAFAPLALEEGAPEFRDCYANLRPLAGDPGAFRTVFARCLVNVPTDRALKLDVLTSSNMRVWWDGAPVGGLEHLTSPRDRVEALVSPIAWDAVAAGQHELVVAFRAGLPSPRAESGFLLFFTDADGQPYHDIAFSAP